MPYYYSIFNLVVESDQPLPHVPSVPPTPQSDVRSQLAHVPDWLQSAPEATRTKWSESSYRDERGEPLLNIFKRSTQGASFYEMVYRSGNQFVIDEEGKNIWRGAPLSASPEQSAPYLLGPLLGFALRLRGITGLHGSAIALAEQAVAFVGEPHRGKSTTAAAFVQAGYPALSDDLVTLVPLQENFMVYPGYPGVRLWLDTAHAVVNSAAALPQVYPDQEKRYLNLAAVPHAFHTSPLPLRRIYVLGERSLEPHAPYVQPLSGHAGLMALIRHTTAGSLTDPSMRARDFEVMGRVAKHVPLRQLVAHADLTCLPDLVKVVLEDLDARA